VCDAQVIQVLQEADQLRMESAQLAKNTAERELVRTITSLREEMKSLSKSSVMGHLVGDVK